MNTILVTGCAGFIGSHLCELLLQKGYKVIGVDNFDAFYSRAIKEANMAAFIKHPAFIFYETDITAGLNGIKEQDITAVVHLAAKAGVRPSIQDPAGYILNNISGTQKVHEFMENRAIDKLVFASSSSVYGNNVNIPFSETDNVDNPISPYAFTKKAGELMNYTFHHLKKADIINLRFFTVYGPRQRPDLAINKFIKQILQNEPLVLFGNGDSARDYTYIDDTVAGIYAALCFCLQNKGVYETVNLGNNRPVKLTELVEAIYKLLGANKNLLYKPMQPGDVDITYADIRKAQSLFDYQPKTGINIGLKNYIDWYKNNNNIK